MARLGFDALSLANNHTGDFGSAALVDTVAAFRGTGISAFGAGRDVGAAARAVVLERHGVRFGFLGFNTIGETPRAGPGRPGALSVRMPPRTGPLHHHDLARVLQAVRRLGRRVDVVVVMPHWGTQYTHRVEPIQRRVGRRLVDAGADLVVGAHPHWVQGMERYRGAVIAYSLGNFVFDMDFMDQTMEGVALTVSFRGDRLRGIELTPYRLDSRFAPRPVRGAAARAILADVGPDGTGRIRLR
jgi:poly-gamma-glutamate synthesis protein (capsule biosynthesis protein)